MTTNTHQINWFVTAGTLRAAFTECKRQDGSTYWALKEEVDDNDLFIDFIRDLHDDEMPNDWRYETIVDICNYLCDLVETIDSQSDAHEIAFSAADSITSIYTSELCQWLSDNRNALKLRLGIDDAQEETQPDCDRQADTFKPTNRTSFEASGQTSYALIHRRMGNLTTEHQPRLPVSRRVSFYMK